MAARLRNRLARQQGFGIVESLVAALLLIIGGLALFGVFDSASKASTSVNRQEVALNQAERQLEWLRTLPYKEIWMSTVPAAGTGSGNPFNRISGSGAGARYAVGGNAANLEELVNTNTTTAGERQGTGIAVGPVPFTVATGTAQQVSGKIYTFVSWRDEECPVVNLGSLQSSLNSINTSLNAPVGTLQSQLNSILGVVGSLTNQAAGVLRNNLNGAGGLVNLVNSVNNQLDTLTASSGYTNLITNGIDLCDAPNVGALEAVQRIKSIVNTIAKLPTDTSNTSSAAANVLNQLGLGGLLCTLLPPLCNALNSSSGIFNGDLGGGGGITGALNSLSNDLTTLTNYLANPNTTHNTKRLSVAVTVDTTRTDVAPLKPIWVSTVVVDADAGLL